MRICLPFMVIVTSLMLFSCASIINGPNTRVQINSENSLKVVVQNDTINIDKSAIINPRRSSQALSLKIITPDTSFVSNIQPVSSLAYYFNITAFAGYGLGFLVDRSKDKRYTYPIKLWVKGDKIYDYDHKNPEFAFSGIIKVTANNLFDFNDFLEPSVYYERKLNNYSSSTFGIGVPVNQFNIRRAPKGFRFGYEHKFYFQNKAPFGQYIGLEFSHLWIKHLAEFGFINEDIKREWTGLFGPNNQKYEEWVQVHKKTYTFNVKYGYQQKIINRFFIDLSVGLGLKNRDIKHTGRSRPQDAFHRPWFDIFNEYAEVKEGNTWRMTLPFSLKLGYSF